jgi:DNA-binding FrmR family transcriptional regulator
LEGCYDLRINQHIVVRRIKFDIYMDKIEVRLKKIEGQIVGIRKMYGERRDCLEIAQQLAAVRSALVGVGKEILSGEAIRCARSHSKQKEFEELIGKLFHLE